VSRIRLYVDEDAMDSGLVRGLRHKGFDVLTAAKAGMLQRTDEDHLRFATSVDHVLYSFNVGDYQGIHSQWMATGRTHAGLILAHQKRYSVREQIRRITRLADALAEESFVNRIEFLGFW
jgi:hypothetical protein